MEDQIPMFHSMIKQTPSFEEQLKRIKRAAEIAQKKIDYVTAHDETILAAIDVVEAFLRKKHRLCYGGQAINAHLPKKHKIYDPEFTVPDYDFFTPHQEVDLQLLITDLKKAGFTEIYVRDGMHEGTVKVYVEYVPIADITAIDPYLYRLLTKRELRVDGISYMDIHTLRMMMYLELSRPRGEVERWGKVYERLMLLNAFAPDHTCSSFSLPPSHRLTPEQLEYTIEWMIQKRRVFAGLDLVDMYDETQKTQKKQKKQTHLSKWAIHARKPILCYSPDPENDAKEILSQWQALFIPTSSSSTVPRYRIQTHRKKGGGEMVPTVTIIYHKKCPMLFLVHQTACHGYFQLPLRHRKETIRIASMDTLITLYFSLSLWNAKWLDMKSMECLANQLIQRSIYLRTHPKKSPFPFISLQCVGHQTSMPSLIRAKVERKTQKQRQLRSLLRTTLRNR